MSAASRRRKGAGAGRLRISRRGRQRSAVPRPPRCGPPPSRRL